MFEIPKNCGKDGKRRVSDIFGFLSNSWKRLETFGKNWNSLEEFCH